MSYADKSGPEGLRRYEDNAAFLDGKIHHLAFPDQPSGVAGGRFVAQYDENGLSLQKKLDFAFDVTPARLVTALNTERGICPASEEGLSGLFPEWKKTAWKATSNSWLNGRPHRRFRKLK
jgi:hypothetical protein